VNHSHKYDACVIPLGRKAQATKAVGDELQVPEMNSFTKGETTAGLVLVVGDDEEC
jgi:hypothetical protein